MLFVAALAGGACSQPYPDAPDEVLMLSFLSVAPAVAAAADAADPENNPIVLKKIFYTSASFNGNLGGVTGADGLCGADANRPDGSTYHAMLVDGTNRIACTNANCTPANASDGTNWVFAPNTTYYRNVSGTLQPVITTNANAVVDFGSATLMNNGFSDSPADEWWTGMGAGWNALNDCSDWGSGGAGNGETGAGQAVDGDAVALGTPTCFLSYRLVCVEQ